MTITKNWTQINYNKSKNNMLKRLTESKMIMNKKKEDYLTALKKLVKETTI